MPKTDHNLLVSTDILHILRRYLAEQGLAAQPLPLAGEQTQPDQVPIETVYRVWNATAARIHDPYFGLHFGQAAPSLLSGRLLPSVMLNSPSLGAALERYCRYHGLMVNGREPVLKIGPTESEIEFDPARPGSQSFAEAVLAMTVEFFRQVSGGRVRPLRVCCPFPRPADSAEFVRVFGCPVEFDQPMQRIILRTADLAEPVTQADAGLLIRLEEYAGQKLERLGLSNTWAQKSAALLSQMMLRGEKPAPGPICAALAVSQRTLQKRLQSEGASYQQVLDETRRSLAEELLTRADGSISEVAFVLGYADQSAFNHAFKRQTGLTPLEYRQSVR